MGIQKIKIELLHDTGILYLDINCNLCKLIKKLLGPLLKMAVATSSWRTIDLLPVALRDSREFQGEINQWRVWLQSSWRTQKGWVSWDDTFKKMSHEIGKEDGIMNGSAGNKQSWRHSSGNHGRQRHKSSLSVANLQSSQNFGAVRLDLHNKVSTAASCAAPLPDHCPRAAIRMLEART